MSVISRINARQAEVAEWRRELHQHPELLYELPFTTALVAEKLRAFGCDEIHTGIGRCGSVALIHGAEGRGTVIGLRADMDALPINEAGDLPWRSQNDGKMHACGHDGHTAMLLGAAQQLAATRRFAGSVALIFQPAEEGGAGGLAMVETALRQ